MDKNYYEITKMTLEYMDDGQSSRRSDVIGRFTDKEKAYAFIKARSLKERAILDKQDIWNFIIDPAESPSGQLNIFLEAQRYIDGGERYVITKLSQYSLNDDDYDNNGNYVFG